MPLPRDSDVAASDPAIPSVSANPTVAVPPIVQRAEYWVRPDGDAWIIAHDGDEYGPYESRRDAMFFAVDAAHKLGEQGRDAAVRLIAAGQPVAAWTYGTDPYPPVLFLDAP
jgi:hypothetical protein